MFQIFTLTVLIIVVINPTISNNVLKPKPSPSPFQDWDYIVFSQRWPITSCSEWKERSPQNTCILPQNNDMWIIHGVWPTKIGTKGPFFCNSALHFDPDQLQPMMTELLEFWPNIEANTKPNSFWKHEWNKHGTCASSLPQFNSVTNYFKQGLQWNQDYNLAEMLAKHNIVPNANGYNVSDIFNAVKATLGKNPIVNCVVDGKSKQSLISEIQLCIDQNFDVIDCNVTQSNRKLYNGDVLINCSPKNDVMYYAELPNNTSYDVFVGDVREYDEPAVGECYENFLYAWRLLKFYNIIKFLIWFTL